MRSRCAFFLGLFVFLVSGSTWATTRPSPCGFSFTGEWLYLSPVIDDPYYVINTSNAAAQLGPREANEFSYDSGFRIQGMYGWDTGCQDVRVAWTYFWTSDDRTVTGPFLHPTEGYIAGMTDTFTDGSARAQNRLHFNRVEGLFGIHLFSQCCTRVTLEGGLQYSSLEDKNNLRYEDSSIIDRFDTQRCYWGVGPQFGFDVSQSLFDCFSIVGTASGALLVGESQVTNVSVNDGTLNVDTRNEKIWRLVPSVQMRLGIDVPLCWFTYNFSVEAGYEWTSYLRGLGTITWTDSTITGASIDTYTDIGFHGLYLSTSLIF